MKFHYTARTRDGQLQAGFVEGTNREAVFNILTKHNLYILSLEPTTNALLEPLLFFFRRVRKTDLMIFTRQLSAMLEAGIALSDGLKALSRQSKNAVLKETILEISLDIDSGLSLSQSLERHSAIFSTFYISLIRTAEVTGRIEEAMSYLADHLEKEISLMSRIRNALIYPGLIIGLFIAVSFVLIAFVFPEIKPVFEEAGVELPTLTQILLATGTFVSAWWGVIVIALAVVLSILVDYFRSDEGKLVLDQVFLHMPVFGGVFRKIYVARFSSAMSILLKGGVPISQALRIIEENIGSATYADILYQSAEGVTRGDSLSTLLGQHPKYFPPLVMQMVAVGEATGKLGGMLERVSTFYTREIDSLIGELVELIQPVIMIVIGILVGLLFASILLPIYDLAQKGF